MTKKIWVVDLLETDNDAENFTSSIKIDKNLYNFDILDLLPMSKCFQNKVISPSDKNKIIVGLKNQKEIESDNFIFSHQLEDIHMNIENSLINKIGTAARKFIPLEVNDQVATDIKLFIKDMAIKLKNDLIKLQKEIKKSEKTSTL